MKTILITLLCSLSLSAVASVSINEYNDVVEKHNKTASTYNVLSFQYNSLVEKYNKLSARYNKLDKPSGISASCSPVFGEIYTLKDAARLRNLDGPRDAKLPIPVLFRKSFGEDFTKVHEGRSFVCANKWDKRGRCLEITMDSERVSAGYDHDESNPCLGSATFRAEERRDNNLVRSLKTK